MYTGISVLSEPFPIFPRTALPIPVVSYSGSSHVVQCDSEPLAATDGPGMGTPGLLFLRWEFSAGTKGAAPLTDSITSFHTCCRSCFQPREPDTEVSIKMGE